MNAVIATAVVNTSSETPSWPSPVPSSPSHQYSAYSSYPPCSPTKSPGTPPQKRISNAFVNPRKVPSEMWPVAAL